MKISRINKVWVVLDVKTGNEYKLARFSEAIRKISELRGVGNANK